MPDPSPKFSSPVDPIDQAIPVPVLAPGDLVSEAHGLLTEMPVEDIDEIAVLDGRAIVGIVRWQDLLRADGKERIRDLMVPDPVVLRPGDSEEAAAWSLASKGQPNLAVAGPDGEFVGLVPAHVLLGRMLTELDDDAARLGGYVAGEDRARRSAEEPIGQRLIHRVPWLVIGLIGAMLSAILVGAFEEELNRKVIIAFFVPAVVYMADAVGTQTETLLIRGMSANIDVKRVVRQEMFTGVLLGALVGLVFYPFVLVGWDDSEAALAVSLALFASCSIATTLATVLPRLLSRFGSDPAFGSGPLATILQDLLSVAVYLGVATVVAF